MLRFKLQIFVITQIFSFVCALHFMDKSFILSALLLFCSGLFMNFSLHITIHHFVHFKYRNRFKNLLFEGLYTLNLGLPFNFYQMQHFNHHRYDNRIGDFTSTWILKQDKIVPKGLFRYVFMWWVPSGVNMIKKSESEGYLSQKENRKLLPQLILIVVLYVFLAIMNPWYCLMYVMMIYIGWSLISLTNYGQHLPRKYGEEFTYSYSGKWYNFLFFNNGLHHEHHKEPHIDYKYLKNSEVNSLSIPHLFAGIFKERVVK